MGPRAHKPAFLISQACQLNLQAALFAVRPVREDFKDKPGPIKNLGIPSGLEIALLNRRQGVIDDSHSGFPGRHDPADLLDFAGAEKRCRPHLRQRHDSGKAHIKSDSFG